SRQLALQKHIGCVLPSGRPAAILIPLPSSMPCSPYERTQQRDAGAKETARHAEYVDAQESSGFEGLSMSDTPKTATSGNPRKRWGIFISYRRADSMNATGRLYERLRKRYGKQHVFKDIDSLHAGDDFAQAIRQSLAQSAVALIMIGRTWADARDQDGKRRLD